MSLRKKTLIIIGITISIFILILYGISHFLLLSSFRELEEQHARQNVARALNALEDHLTNLNMINQDWAAWDDTYAFIEDLNEDYLRSNLIDATFSGTGLNLMIFVNSSGEIVLSKLFDLDKNVEMPLPESLKQHLTYDNILLNHPDTKSSVRGIILLPENPLLISSEPIITSENEGPIRGSLIFGRFLDSSQIKNLAVTTRVSLQMRRLNTPDLPADFITAKSALSEHGRIFTQPLNKHTIAGYAVIKDIYGTPSLILRADMPRDIYAQGETTITYFLLTLLAVGLGFGLIFMVLLEKQILRRLAGLNNNVNRIRMSGNSTQRVSVTGNDELSSLANSINDMLESIHESEKKLYMILESSEDMIMMLDRDGKYLYFNGSSRYHTNSQEFIGKTPFDLFDRETAAKMMENIEKVISSGESLYAENEIKWKGERLCFSDELNPVLDENDEVVGVVSISRNITDKKQAIEALKKSEEQYRTLVETMKEGIAIVNTEETITFVNRGATEMFGYPREELIGMNLKELTSPDQFRQILDQTSHRKAGEIGQYEITTLRKDGKQRVLLVTATPRISETGVYQGAFGIFHDITERKAAEKALKESELQYRMTLDSMGDAIHVIDSNFRLLLFNKILVKWLKKLGLTIEANEITGNNIFEVFPFLSPKVKDEYHEVFDTGTPLITQEVFSLGGEEFITETRKIPVLEAGEIIRVVTVIRDITQQVMIEDKLKKIQTLESLGILAGGIAHDFNNILTGILSNISLAKMYSIPENEVYEILSESENAAFRAKQLTQQLLSLAKGGAPIKTSFSIKKLIKKSTCMVVQNADINCEFNLPEDLWNVEADEGQMTQVIKNLAVNAKNAMPEGGTIYIQAENLVVDESVKLPIVEGRYIKITISDEGVGISEENLSKIFDPYFSTNFGSSGVGLSVTHATIMRHNGYIDVKSELDKGTTFYIYLPAATESSTPESESEKKNVIDDTKGKVLLMDDEDIILKSSGKLLRKLGYTVECASHGQKAIELFKHAREVGKPFDAVVLDLTIPDGMGGKECVQKLKEIDPDVKAIVSSGYSNESIMASYEKYGFCAVISKPYKIKELAELLNSLHP